MASKENLDEQERSFRERYGLVDLADARNSRWPPTSGQGATLEGETACVMEIAARKSSGCEDETLVGHMRDTGMFCAVVPGSGMDY